jgi:3-mercaptopyruvate sulfurtransferase SseA
MLLRIFGFQNVSVLEGGYRAWLDAGLPIEQTAPRRVEQVISPPVMQTRRGSVRERSEN